MYHASRLIVVRAGTGARATLSLAPRLLANVYYKMNHDGASPLFAVDALSVQILVSRRAEL